MNNSEFIYTTYIKSTPQKVWDAITNPEFCRQYWGGYANISEWKKGATWQHVSDDKTTVRIVGEVLESNPPHHLVLSWAEPDNKADDSRVTFDIEVIDDMVCLHVAHNQFKPGSDMAGKVSKGWPRVLSSMKTYLETGKGLNIMACKAKAA